MLQACNNYSDKASSGTTTKSRQHYYSTHGGEPSLCLCPRAGWVAKDGTSLIPSIVLFSPSRNDSYGPIAWKPISIIARAKVAPLLPSQPARAYRAEVLSNQVGWLGQRGALALLSSSE